MNQFKIKLSEMVEFSDGLQRKAAGFPQFLLNYMNDKGKAILERTKERTPVGTPESTGIPGYVGGTLRRHWERSQAEIRGDEIFVTFQNPIEYASHVEFGHRIVAWGRDTGREKPGRFMLRNSIIEVEEEMRKELPVKLKRYVEDGE